jgi:hypothetical protein
MYYNYNYNSINCLFLASIIILAIITKINYAQIQTPMNNKQPALITCDFTIADEQSYNSLIDEYYTQNFKDIEIWNNPQKILRNMSPEIDQATNQLTITHLKNEYYLAPVIQAYILNDKQIGDYYETYLTEKASTDKLEKASIRCTIENLIAEYERNADATRALIQLAQEFEFFHEYLIIIHKNSHEYSYSDQLATNIIREFVKLFLFIDPTQFGFGIVHKVTTSIHDLLIGHYVDKLRFFVQMMDEQDFRNIDIDSSNANVNNVEAQQRIERISTHLIFYFYWMENEYYPGTQEACADDIEQCINAQFQLNAKAFSQGLVIPGSTAQSYVLY